MTFLSCGWYRTVQFVARSDVSLFPLTVALAFAIVRADGRVSQRCVILVPPALSVPAPGYRWDRTHLAGRVERSTFFPWKRISLDALVPKRFYYSRSQTRTNNVLPDDCTHNRSGTRFLCYSRIRDIDRAVFSSFGKNLFISC